MSYWLDKYGEVLEAIVALFGALLLDVSNRRGELFQDVRQPLHDFPIEVG